jgi:hypothetical protein
MLTDEQKAKCWDYFKVMMNQTETKGKGSEDATEEFLSEMGWVFNRHIAVIEALALAGKVPQ